MSASSKMTSLNLSFNGEIRRLSVASDSLTYQDLMSKTLSVFPDLTSIQFSWVDDENDKVVISSDEELSEALRVTSSENKGYLRFEVLAGGAQSQDMGNRQDIPASHSSSKASSPVATATAAATSFGTITHAGVECDACGSYPLTGSRFKCTVRNNFNLCETCEAKLSHPPYPMVKIYRPDQVPAGVTVLIAEDSSDSVRHRQATLLAQPAAAAGDCNSGVVCEGCYQTKCYSSCCYYPY